MKEDLLMNIVNMLNKLGLEAEIEKRFNKVIYKNTVILKVHNPSNNLICCLEMREDLLEEGEE